MCNVSQESPTDGVVIGEEVGMRMKVGEWISSWLCREEGVRLPQDNRGKKLKQNFREDFKYLRLA